MRRKKRQTHMLNRLNECIDRLERVSKKGRTLKIGKQKKTKS